MDKKRDLRFVVIGAGMAGILSGIKLLEAGFSNICIYEKADKIGGTWRENTYPGLTCDSYSNTRLELACLDMARAAGLQADRGWMCYILEISIKG